MLDDEINEFEASVKLYALAKLVLFIQNGKMQQGSTKKRTGDRRTINQKGRCILGIGSDYTRVYKYVGCGVVSFWNDIDSWVTTSLGDRSF